ncbi:MAG: acylphosphatase [Acidimicrobiales bacterium]|nr:acylphosphatase [Acidimicrobiales bacterium]
MAPQVIRRHLFVSGRVQGVWFRDSCRAEAERLGVRGWVRNLWDGRVEAVFEGAPDAVLELVNWAHHGPPRAEVTHVEILTEEPLGERGFRVR